MKFFSFLLATVALCLAPACERIPPSKSIPGYEEKKAAEKKEESRTLGTSDNPPTFFPSVGDSSPASGASEKDDN